MQHAKNPRRSEGRSHGGKPCPATTPQSFAGTGRLPDNDCEPDRNATESPCWAGGFAWSGRRDSNPRPSPWQGMPTCSAYLRKRPETVSDLRFWLITGSRRFALFRDVSRPVRGLRKAVGPDQFRLSRGTVEWCLRVSLLSDVPVQGRRRSPAKWRIDLDSNTSSWMSWLINRDGRCVLLRNSAPIWKHDSVVRNKDG